ncbi:splicing factor 3B subunit 1, partial [Tanacetum coccineum]
FDKLLEIWIRWTLRLRNADSRFQGYNTEIPLNDDDETADATNNELAVKMASYTAHKSMMNDIPHGADDESLGFNKSKRIIDREDDYRRRRLNQVISPERHDAFASGDKTPKPESRGYAEIMREAALKREKEETLKVIARRKKEEEENKAAGKDKETAAAQPAQKRRNRWDQSQDKEPGAKKAKSGSDWDMPDSTPGIGRWDATPTPGRMGDATPSLSRKNRWDETPTPGRVTDSDATPAGGVTPGATPAGMAWDATPKLPGMATPTPKRQRSRWDETPATMGSATPGGATPAAAYTPGVTPFGGVDLATPTPGAIQMRAAMTPEQYNLARHEKDIEDRNRPLTDEELDVMFPQEGYKILEPPASYVPIRTPARKLLATPTPLGTPLYSIPEENRNQMQLTDKAREFGAGPLFNRILPLLMQPTLEDQERHLLVKVIDRVLYKLDELVRPYVHKILVVIEPLLIDEDYYARVEGREIISNLSKAAGLATMIAAMRPD